MSSPYHVLFLCTGNSARSIMAEAILNKSGAGKFKAHSAGSLPKRTVNPHAIALLERLGYPTSGLRSKSWDEFAGEDAPQMDFVFTVCDNAANEPCPVWPGQPMTAHWGLPDPAIVRGDERIIGEAFSETYRLLKRRIELFAALKIEALDRLALMREIDAIGQSSRLAHT